MTDKETQSAQLNRPDTTQVVPLIQRIERLNAHQARCALRIYVTNNPAACQAVAEALDVAETY